MQRKLGKPGIGLYRSLDLIELLNGCPVAIKRPSGSGISRAVSPLPELETHIVTPHLDYHVTTPVSSRAAIELHGSDSRSEAGMTEGKQDKSWS